MLQKGRWEGQTNLPADFVVQCVSDQITGDKPDDTSNVDFENLEGTELTAALGYGPRFERPYGLLWWLSVEPTTAVTDRLLRRWRRGGVDESFVKRMETLKGVPSDEIVNEMTKNKISESEFITNIVAQGHLDWDVIGWNNQGFSAEGYLGQYLVVSPTHQSVAVRMRRSPPDQFDERKIDRFADFKQLIFQLCEKSNQPK